MKVTTQDLSQASAAGATNTQEIHKGAAGKSGCSSSGGGDQVAFSSTLNSLSQAMNSDASSRQAKVQALAGQYQSGTYKVDSAAISRAMVSEALAA
jgi:anti-sigma28 factor (negative regulator of flagellin synthesis)